VRDTNREFSSDFAHVFTIADGKIVAFSEFMDTAAVVGAHQKAMNA
jgi:ketosteroid isomerase-like protein